MLNWLTRYAPVRELLLDDEGRLHDSVLDVGSGSHGFACTGSQEPFVGLDISFPEELAPSIVPVKGAPGAFPFADAAFDTVVSLDTLEHIPGPDRAAFVAELARVAARRVLVACPSSEGAYADDLIRQVFVNAGLPVPEWLGEHDEFGLPTPEEIAAACELGPAFRVRPLRMPNGLLSLLAVVGDMLPALQPHSAAELEKNREDWLSLFRDGTFGDSPRKGFVLERVAPVHAVVDRFRLDETLLDSFRCLGCGGGFAGADVRVCRGCGAPLARDVRGIWDLGATKDHVPDLHWISLPHTSPQPAPARLPQTAPAGAVAATAVVTPLRTTAATRLWLAPDWHRVEEWLPVVSTYVARADLDGDTCLCLAVDQDEVSLDLALELISTACEAAAGSADFAQVLVVDEPHGVDRRGVVEIESVAALRAALGLRGPGLPTPAAIVAHARRSKDLADRLRDVVERARFLAAPDPIHERDPLVTVRIATWGGTDLLLSRAVPSVLEGSYGNVELLVVSDGPDPAARRAVEGLHDARVRYEELPVRPAYPVQDWNFWQSAGSHAVNHALDVARGSYIAPLDHDDAFTQDHIQVLLDTLRSRGADFVYGQAACERRNGPWEIVGSEPLTHGLITHGSVLYSRRLAHFRYDPACWLVDDPGDWNLWRRMQAAGAAMTHLERVVFVHFRERSSIEDDPTVDPLHAMERGDEELAADVVGTGAAWLLDVAWRN